MRQIIKLYSKNNCGLRPAVIGSHYFLDLTFGGHFEPSIEEFSGEITNGIAVARVSSLQMYSMGVTNV